MTASTGAEQVNPSEPRLAVWYWRYHAPGYALFADEEDAACYAVGMMEAEQGVVAGVQFADGRTLTPSRWPAYDAEQERRYAEDEADRREREAAPPAPRRTVTMPFDGAKVEVPVDAPSWLGQP